MVSPTHYTIIHPDSVNYSISIATKVELFLQQYAVSKTITIRPCLVKFQFVIR